MCRGFCCKDGWFDLIDTLCAQIQHHIDQTGAPQVVATQVKEKFGALRFYYDGGDSHIRSLVEMAVAKSKNTCEECGTPGEVFDGGWVVTRCSSHAPQKSFPTGAQLDTSRPVDPG